MSNTNEPLGTPDELLVAVYDDLRHLAKCQLAKEKPNQTLQPTALVHEAFIRLTKNQTHPNQFDGRAHFFFAIAEVMRRILVENARRKKRLRHGGACKREDIDPSTIPAPYAEVDLLALDDAIQRLAATQPDWAQLVKLRYYVGMTTPEAARALGISARTAHLWWSKSRDWLKIALR